MANKSKTTTSLKNADFGQALDVILSENQEVLAEVDLSSVAQLAQSILNADRIFVAGEGRSGLAIQMAAMRLMHLGLEVHVVGEVTAPSIAAKDLLIACSGSGDTHGVVDIAQAAKELGTKLVTITTSKDSSLGKLAETVVQIKAASKQSLSNRDSEQFAGSLFEQSTLLLFDALFYVLANHLHKNAEVLMSRHTNLE